MKAGSHLRHTSAKQVFIQKCFTRKMREKKWLASHNINEGERTKADYNRGLRTANKCDRATNMTLLRSIHTATGKSDKCEWQRMMRMPLFSRLLASSHIALSLSLDPRLFSLCLALELQSSSSYLNIYHIHRLFIPIAHNLH